MSTTIATLETDEATARLLAERIGDLFDPEDMAASAFEYEPENAIPTAVPRPKRQQDAQVGAMGTLLPDGTLPWRAELYFGDAPDEAEIRALVADLAGEEAAKALTFREIAMQDWVSASLEGLNPVKAGRVRIHGAHDRATVKANEIGIEIEAALAFGTGHHGTTRGCLLHFDALLKRARPRHIVDIGTGTGVLAIAAARLLKQKVQAGEIDPDSVLIARANARLNGAGAYIRPVRAAGLQHPALRRRRHYDVVFANILAKPLRGLAPQIAAATAPRGHLILSGLLAGDVPGILSRYRAAGFHPVAQMQLESWVSLLMRRGGAKPPRLQ